MNFHSSRVQKNVGSSFKATFDLALSDTEIVDCYGRVLKSYKIKDKQCRWFVCLVGWLVSKRPRQQQGYIVDRSQD